MNEGSGEQDKSSELQFDKVEVAVPDALRVCSRCKARLEHEYFETDGHFICPACAGEVAEGVVRQADDRPPTRAVLMPPPMEA